MATLYIRKITKLVDLLYISLVLLPVFDAINGFLINQKNIYGVGSLYHLFVTILCIIYLLRTKLKNNVYFKILLICSSSILVSIFLNLILGEKIQSDSIDRIFKMITTVFYFYFFYILQKKENKKNDFLLLIQRQIFLIYIITLLADLTGICNFAYTNSGRIGLYAGSNEPTIIFTITQVFLLWFITNRTKLSDLILFLIGEVCIVLTESKSGIVVSLILFIFFLIILKGKKDISKSFKILAIFPIVFVGIIIGIQFVIPLIKNSFVARQSFLFEAWSSKEGTLAYISSGRIPRIESFILQSLADYFNFNPFIGVIKTVFGIGATGEFIGTVIEMDYFDILRYGGIVWIVCFFVLTQYVLTRAYNRLNSKIVFFAFVIIFIESFFIGHVWNGGNSGIFFAMLCIFMSNNNWFRL